jgi:hypothetical protein
VEGRPFFPFGFYFTSTSPLQRLGVLKEVADGKFNTVSLFWRNLDEYRAFLDEADRRRVRVITEIKGGEQALDVVVAHRGHPAVLGWSVADDAGDHASAEAISALVGRVKRLDPGALTYLSVSGYSLKWSLFGHLTDLVGGQSYPIARPSSRFRSLSPFPVEEVSIVFQHGVAEVHPRPVLANLQTFRWEEGRWPTPDEISAMTYAALVRGVKGVVYYSYENGDGRVTEAPELWARLRSLAAQISLLGPILAQLRPMLLDTHTLGVLAGVWRGKEQSCLLLVNTRSAPSSTLSVPLPKGLPELSPLTPSGGSPLQIREGVLSGTLGPLEVAAFATW